LKGAKFEIWTAQFECFIQVMLGSQYKALENSVIKSFYVHTVSDIEPPVPKKVEATEKWFRVS